VNTLEELAPFVEDREEIGQGNAGDILEIQGMPLAFWSHLDCSMRSLARGFTRSSMFYCADGWAYVVGESGAVAAGGDHG